MGWLETLIWGAAFGVAFALASRPLYRLLCWIGVLDDVSPEARARLESDARFNLDALEFNTRELERYLVRRRADIAEISAELTDLEGCVNPLATRETLRDGILTIERESSEEAERLAALAVAGVRQSKMRLVVAFLAGMVVGGGLVGVVGAAW